MTTQKRCGIYTNIHLNTHIYIHIDTYMYTHIYMCVYIKWAIISHEKERNTAIVTLLMDLEDIMLS